MLICCNATAVTSPPPPSSATLQVTTSYEGPYAFVLDNQLEHNLAVTSAYRVAAIRKFKQALQKSVHALYELFNTQSQTTFE